MPVVTLAIAPSGQVVFLPDGGEGPALPDEVAARIGEAFHEGTAAGLLHLAAAELTTPLPPAFVFWRDFSRRCLTQLCRIASVESEAPDTAAPPPSREEFLRIVETSPLPEEPKRERPQLRPAFMRRRRGSAGRRRRRSARGKRPFPRGVATGDNPLPAAQRECTAISSRTWTCIGSTDNFRSPSGAGRRCPLRSATGTPPP